MNNTIQLYMDEKQEIKGYPITSPDRVIDENGVNIKEQLDTIQNKENWVSVLDFGAKCDGITDDSDALQNAINTINTHTTPKGQWKRCLYVPAKLRVTKEISIPFGQFKIKGNSLNNSQIFLDGTNACLNFYNTTNRHEVEIEDIWIKGNDTNETLIKMNKIINIYFTRVNVSNHGENKYAIELTDCGIYFFDKCVIQGGADLTNGGTRCGILETQNSKGAGSIISITGCNVWNLKEFMCTNGSIQKINIYDNWIECVKTVLKVNSVNDMRYSNISIKDNFINNHNEGGFVITEFAFIDIINTVNSDWFGGLISVETNTFYLWDLTNIKNNSLISMNTILSGTELSINYITNTFSGKRLDQLSAYVFNTNDIANFIGSVYFRNVSTCLRIDTTTITNKKELITSGMNLNNKKYGSPNGFYFSDSATLNDGNIYYENGNFYCGYRGKVQMLPKRSNFELTTANTSSFEGVNIMLNAITDALAQANIIIKK